jgi:cobalt transporter subunit CbtA
VFRQIAVIAAIAGLACGVLLTLLQQVEIVPLIRQAELFEKGAHGAPPGWLATLAANVVLATGFALLLAAAIVHRGTAGWRRGLLWGAAGYLAFFAAPALGLPPELPGAEHAALVNRQAWWIATAASSAGGLWIACFTKVHAVRALGIVLIVLPHLAGAPDHAIHGSSVPAELAAEFVRAAWLVNAMFWLALGTLTAALAAR